MYSFRAISFLGVALALGACNTDVVFEDGPENAAGGGIDAAASTGSTGKGGGGDAGAGGLGQGGAGAAAQGGAGGGVVGNGVPCPDQACGPDSSCLLCKDVNGGDLQMCRDNFDWPADLCPQMYAWGPLYAECDGPEDCAPNEICSTGFLGSAGGGARARCLSNNDPMVTCVDDCSCGGYGGAICHSLADCPPCAAECAIYDAGLPFPTCQ